MLMFDNPHTSSAIGRVIKIDTIVVTESLLVRKNLKFYSLNLIAYGITFPFPIYSLM